MYMYQTRYVYASSYWLTLFSYGQKINRFVSEKSLNTIRHFRIATENWIYSVRPQGRLHRSDHYFVVTRLKESVWRQSVKCPHLFYAHVEISELCGSLYGEWDFLTWPQKWLRLVLVNIKLFSTSYDPYGTASLKYFSFVPSVVTREVMLDKKQ